MTERSKKCFKCGEVKILSAFYKRCEMSDGYSNKCKDCTKVDTRLNRRVKLEHYQQYTKVRQVYSGEPMRVIIH